MDEVRDKKIREASKQAAASYTSTTGAWITKGLVVKVMAEELQDYYKRKGEVVGVVDEYLAEVEMLDSGDVLRIDQAQLETVCTASHTNDMLTFPAVLKPCKSHSDFSRCKMLGSRFDCLLSLRTQVNVWEQDSMRFFTAAPAVA